MKNLLVLALVCLSSVSAVRVLARQGPGYGYSQGYGYPAYSYAYPAGYYGYEEPHSQQEYFREQEQRQSHHSHSESHSYELEHQAGATDYDGSAGSYGGGVYEVHPTGGCASLQPQYRAACYARLNEQI